MNINKEIKNSLGDAACEHGTAWDVHCCNCHSGFFPPDDCCCITSPDVTLDELDAALAQEIGIDERDPKLAAKGGQ
jgi:hypothetical protein